MPIRIADSSAKAPPIRTFLIHSGASVTNVKQRPKSTVPAGPGVVVAIGSPRSVRLARSLAGRRPAIDGGPGCRPLPAAGGGVPGADAGRLLAYRWRSSRDDR